MKTEGEDPGGICPYAVRGRKTGSALRLPGIYELCLSAIVPDLIHGRLQHALKVLDVYLSKKTLAPGHQGSDDPLAMGSLEYKVRRVEVSHIDAGQRNCVASICDHRIRPNHA